MPTPTDKPKRRWQFSLRSLLIFVTLVCVCLGLFVVPELQRRSRCQTYRTRWAKMGATVNHDASCDDEVTELRINDNQGASQMSEIWKLKELVKLDLLGSRLTTLPPEIGGLAKLEELSFGSKQLTTLAPEIGNLTNLTQLMLFGPITTLPPEIGQLTKLEGLYLVDTQLTALPPEIGKLTELTELDLQGNPITDADLEFLKSLKKLALLLLGGTNVTAEGIADLKRAIPNCRIVSNF